MKRVFIILVLSFLPLIGSAQSTAPSQNEVVTETLVKKTEANKTTALKAETKATLNHLNYKKSNELISIKAYRKSLQIKARTIKLC